MSDVTTKWQRSSFCADGACVEVAFLGDHVAMRDSKRKDGPPMILTNDDWAGLIRWLDQEGPAAPR